AVDFAGRKIDERHVSLARNQTQIYSIRGKARPALGYRAYQSCRLPSVSARWGVFRPRFSRICGVPVTFLANRGERRSSEGALTRAVGSASIRSMAKAHKPSRGSSGGSKGRARRASKSMKKKLLVPPPPPQRGGVELVDPRVQAQLKVYDEALALFHQQKFARAKQELEKVLERQSKALADRARVHLRIPLQRLH